MLGTIVMLELSLDQQQEAGLFLRAQRRPAPSWFILLLLLLLQMVEYSEIDGVDSIIIKVSLAEFVNVIDYNPRLAPGTQGILRPACCGAVSSVSKSTCECFCLWYHTQPSREGELLECPLVTRVGAPKGAALFEWPALHYSPSGALSPFSVVVPQKHQVWIWHQRGVGIPSIGSGCLYLSGGLVVASAWFWQPSAVGWLVIPQSQLEEAAFRRAVLA